MARLFFLTRGVAGCGKSTFIKENNLEHLCVSSDKIRLLLSSPIQDETGKECIDQRLMKQSWSMITNILETRFRSGATTILDATNLKEKDIRPLRNLAREYRYRVYIIDFTDIPEEEIYRRNANRDVMARVPEHVITRMLNVLKNSTVPTNIEVLTREEALDLLKKPYTTHVDSNNTKNVHIIGDIHGCGSALSTLMFNIGDTSNTIEIEADTGYDIPFKTKTISFALPKENEKYIFLGDYFERGIENAHVFKYLDHITNKPEYDVSILIGNHERWLRHWIKGDNLSNKDFFKHVIPQFEASSISKKDASKFLNKLGQYVFANISNENETKQFFMTHGGISHMPEIFANISTSEMMFGSSDYENIDIVEESWEEQASTHGIIQIHGHRNFTDEIFISPHVINLDSDAYEGGTLSAVSINCKNFDIKNVSVKNDVFYIPVSNINLNDANINEVIEALRANNTIVEKELDDSISSFNFSRKAFAEKIWNHQNIHARGLFIDTKNNRIKARSYDKFFSIGEREETHLEKLAISFDYPVVAYAKENGYLGICSWDKNDTLFCASKSTNQGIFAERFREILHETLKDKVGKFSSYLKEHDLSAVFEVIDPEYDFHIIEYDYPVVVLLSCIRNKIMFEEISYEELVQIGKQFGLKVKTKAVTINNAQELIDWYSKVKAYDYMFNGYNSENYGNKDGNDIDGYHIEGFVLQDSKNYMVKVKGDFYQYWKFFRSVAKDISKRNKSSKVNAKAYVAGFANTPNMNNVYEFLKTKLATERGVILEEEPNIIELRKEYSNI